MSSTPKLVEIEVLERKLSELKEQKEKLSMESRQFAQKRDVRNQQSRGLRVEISRLREKRDELNEKVKESKLQRDAFRESKHEKIDEIKKVRRESRKLIEKKPSTNHLTLQKEVESIDWKIQTTSTSPEEEKELVGQVRKLETQLNVYRRLAQLNQRINRLQEEIRSLNTETERSHDNLTKTAEESQQIHQTMVQKIDETRKLKQEADNLHKDYLNTKEKMIPIQQEMTRTSDQIKLLKEEIRSQEEQTRKGFEEAVRKKLRQQAMEKLKRHEQLSWEEFQVLAEKGMNTQG